MKALEADQALASRAGTPGTPETPESPESPETPAGPSRRDFVRLTATLAALTIGGQALASDHGKPGRLSPDRMAVLV